MQPKHLPAKHVVIILILLMQLTMTVAELWKQNVLDAAKPKAFARAS
jgi:hypothetical protein